MAWTQADIDTLKSAIGRGIKIAWIGHEKVEYASMKEMQAALALMEAEVTGANRNTVVIAYPYTTRGL